MFLFHLPLYYSISSQVYEMAKVGDKDTPKEVDPSLGEPLSSSNSTDREGIKKVKVST
jgi:hypothetical protein